MPEWKDGVERLEYLHDRGSTPMVFTFKEPFAADGSKISIDREKLRRIVSQNVPRQRRLLAYVNSLKV